MSTSGVPISTKSLLYSFESISSLSFEFRSSETYGCETHVRYILTYVNINFRFFYFSQNLMVLLVASSLSFEFRSSETYGCETQGGRFLRTQTSTSGFSILAKILLYFL